MMKLKKIAICAVSAVCFLATSAANLWAAETVITEPYTYRVTVSTGNDLVFDASDADFSIRVKTGSKMNDITLTDDTEAAIHYTIRDRGRMLEICGLSYGDYVNVSDAVKSIDSSATKYYVKGVRFTGSDEIAVENFQVVGDADYVVAYGVLNDPVEYMVKYVDQNGNTLASDGKYYANAGDRIIVAARQIDGYLPDANNKARTLSKERENVFTFVYHSAAGTTNVIYNTLTGTTTYIYEDGTTSTIRIPNPANGQAGAVITPESGKTAPDHTGAGNTNAGNTDTGNTDAGNTDTGNTNEENTDIGNTDTENTDTGNESAGITETGETSVEEDTFTTQDLIDLDEEEEVPLVAQEGNLVRNLAPIIAGLFVAVVVAGILTLLLISRRHKSGNEKSENSEK